jgi:hypothetical protein
VDEPKVKVVDDLYFIVWPRHQNDAVGADAFVLTYLEFALELAQLIQHDVPQPKRLQNRLVEIPTQSAGTGPQILWLRVRG